MKEPQATGVATLEGQRCADCGAEPEMYMVSDAVWERSGLPFFRAGLCLADLARRIGRPLTDEDFWFRAEDR